MSRLKLVVPSDGGAPIPIVGGGDTKDSEFNALKNNPIATLFSDYLSNANKAAEALYNGDAPPATIYTAIELLIILVVLVIVYELVRELRSLSRAKFD